MKRETTHNAFNTDLLEAQIQRIRAEESKLTPAQLYIKQQKEKQYWEQLTQKYNSKQP